MTPQETRALALFTQLANLSPDDGNVDARITIRLGDGKFTGDVLLSARDMEALTDAVASLNAYRRDMRDDTDPTLAPAATEQLHPDALADLKAYFASLGLGDTDGGA
ncbi:hypothetical protein ACFV27_37155 [Streptomyces antimycoticus]|uniref:hypothetical protein n=1 Tax=Streptomyces antimycoticus TaxID=68175 RepID=UPI0036A165F3